MATQENTAGTGSEPSTSGFPDFAQFESVQEILEQNKCAGGGVGLQSGSRWAL